MRRNSDSLLIVQDSEERFCVEEGVFAVMDSASAFDDLPENSPTMNINTKLVNQLCAWLQEKVNMPSKQFSGAVTAVEE